MGLTPAFKIIAESNDITSKLESRLMGITVTDNSGNKADTVEIKLDDEDHIIQFPNPKAKLEIWLGYKETFVEKLGTFIVDEVEVSGFPNTMTIRAKSADLNEALKEPRDKTWQKEGKDPERIKLTEIIEEIAGTHQLEPLIGDEFKDTDFQVVNQTNESDMHLLNRLAGKVGAIAKPAGEFLLFLKKGQSKTASGKDIPPLSVSPKGITSWSVSIVERGNFNKVIAKYRDKAQATDFEVPAGESGPTFTISKLFQDETEAKNAAKAQLETFQRGKHTLDLTLPGNPSYMAEAQLELINFRDGIEKKWLVESVTHTLSSQGYTAKINAIVNNSSN